MCYKTLMLDLNLIGDCTYNSLSEVIKVEFNDGCYDDDYQKGVVIGTLLLRTLECQRKYDEANKLVHTFYKNPSEKLQFM